MTGYLAGDGLGEDALPLQDRGHCRDHRSANRLALALIVDKEERAIPQDGAAERATKLIASIVRLRLAGRLEVVPRVQRLVAEELEHVAVEAIRAALGREIDDAAVETAEFRRRTVRFDLEFLDRVDDRKIGDLSRFRLQDRNAIEEILVRPWTPAIDAWQLRIGGKRDTGCQARERDEGPPVQRQLHDVPFLDDRPETGGLGAQHRGVGRDGDLLVHVSDSEIQIEPHLLTGGDRDAVTPGAA